mmetsp:Transcript_52304/g.140014  ORF Transcript_52304/g.140014 Transcript_52304/m.140014 type:complete len:279 (-) Transcript_52304:189-1025(-)
MEPVPPAVALLQPRHHGPGPHERQDDVLRCTVKGVQEELDVLLRRDATHVDEEEGVGDAEGVVPPCLCDLRLGQVDAEGPAIHHWPPRLGHHSRFSHAGRLQKAPGLLGHWQEGAACHRPVPVAPEHKEDGRPRVEAANEPAELGEAGVAGRDRGDVRVHRDDQRHVAEDAGRGQDLHGGLLRPVHDVRSCPADDFHQRSQVLDAELHAEVLAVDGRILRVKRDVLDARNGSEVFSFRAVNHKVRRHHCHFDASLHQRFHVGHDPHRDSVDLARQPRV